MQKIIVLIAMIASFSATAKSQATKSNVVTYTPTASKKEMTFNKVDVEAAFPGADAAWRNYVAQKLIVRIATVNGAPQGSYTVIVRFVVSRSGNVGKIITETNFGFGMEAEAARFIRDGPKWIPALLNGHNVASWRRQPITFVVP